MKNTLLAPTLLALAVTLTACNTVPRTTNLLEQSRNDFTVMESNPHVERYAPLQLQDATEAMKQANAASDHRLPAEEIDNLAYLAKAKIAVAQEVTKQKLAEAESSNIIAERDRLVLKQKTKEAERAKMNAAQSQLTAQAALATAASLQRSTEQAQSRTAQLEKELADLAAKKTDRGIVITLGDVLFGFDKSSLSPEGTLKIQKLASVLKQYSERRVLIEGFTDNTGSASYNQKLSERRANAVRHSLQHMGIEDDRVRIRGYGKDFPVAPNDSEENRHLNRRVEIILSDENGKIPQR